MGLTLSVLLKDCINVVCVLNGSSIFNISVYGTTCFPADDTVQNDAEKNTCISADNVEYVDVVDAVNIDDCVLDHVCGSSKFKLVSADQLTSATIHESIRRY